MSLNHFYLLLFGLLLSGGLLFVLLVEICKIRHFMNAIQGELKEAKRRVCLLASESWIAQRKTEDLEAVTAVQSNLIRSLSTASVNQGERLKRIESSRFVLVRNINEASEPAEVHPFTPDAFVTAEPVEVVAA